MSRFSQEFRFEKLAPSFVSGLIVGIIIVIIEMSFGALIFSGKLSGSVADGIGLALTSAIIIGIVVSLTSSYPGMIAIPQDVPAAITALSGIAIVSTLGPSAPRESVVATVIAVIAVTSVCSGIFFLVLGRFRLGDFVRFIPYPVVGGFLAGTGWLLLIGGIGVATGVPVSLENLGDLFKAAVLLKWVSGISFAALLMAAIFRFRHFAVMPLMILGAVGLFYLILAATGTSIAEASAAGWFLGPFPGGSLIRPITLSDISSINWVAVLGQAGNIGSVVIISVLSLLLNSGGLELTVKRDIDLNRELTSAGYANILTGLVGGTAGYQALSLSTLGYRVGVNSRLVGIFSSIVCGIVLVFGASIVSVFPKIVLGSLIILLGFTFLIEWVWGSYFRLPRAEWYLILLIVTIVAGFGFLVGVSAGLIVAIILFVVNYGRIDVVRHELTGVNLRSNVDRTPPQMEILGKKGEEIYILKLSGFLFFGTAHILLKRLLGRIDDTSRVPLRFVVLDFRLVTGLDSSAVESFVKMGHAAEKSGFVLVLTALSPSLRHRIEHEGLPLGDDKIFRLFDDLDHGIEWCEDRILSTERTTAPEAVTLDRVFSETFPDPKLVPRLMGYLEKMEIEENTLFLRQDDPADTLYFLESGRLTAELVLPDGTKIRLRTMGAGSVVGEIGLYQGISGTSRRSASVTSDTRAVVYGLSREALIRMERDDPPVAAAFHRFIVGLLSNRLVLSNRTVEALLK